MTRENIEGHKGFFFAIFVLAAVKYVAKSSELTPPSTNSLFIYKSCMEIAQNEDKALPSLNICHNYRLNPFLKRPPHVLSTH